jgi:hypothetical protein
MSNMINMPEGWSDLRSHLCTYVGDRLQTMSMFGKGHPADMDPEYWAGLLLHHGEILSKHGANDGNGDALADDFAAAKESLRWVADNLERLWD